MNINSLPDVVLRHIFSYLPPVDQILLNLVTPKWKSLQSSVTSTRKSLTLFIGERNGVRARSLITESSLSIPHLAQINSDDSSSRESTLEVTELHDDLTALLVSLFPQISSLCLVLMNETSYENVKQVILLVKKWSKSLESLSFYCHIDNMAYCMRSMISRLFQLIRVINQHCLALECLTFEVNQVLFDEGADDQPNLELSCLSHLREFKFCSADNATILFASLKKYGASDRLEKISIGNNNTCHDERCRVMVDFVHYPRIAAKFAYLPHFHISIQHFATFNSLTSLKIKLKVPLTTFSAKLAPLHSLIYLDLTFPDSLAEELSEQYDAIPTYRFHSLPSVKILSLNLKAHSHAALASRHWSTIFPSIQFVEVFIFITCNLCSTNPEFPLHWSGQGFTFSNAISIEQCKKKQCLKKLLAPLKQFDQLKMVVTSDRFPFKGRDKKEWTIEELNEE